MEECPRKFLLKYRFGIQPPGHSSALNIGGIFHTVLRSLYAGEGVDSATTAALHEKQKLARRLTKEATNAGFLPNGGDLQRTLDKVDEEYYKAVGMALTFWKSKPIDLDQLEPLRGVDGKSLAERKIEVAIDGIDLPIVIQLDLPMVHKGTDKVTIYDFKTTSVDSSSRAATVLISLQLQLYRLGLQHYLDTVLADSGLKVAQVCLCIMQKPSIKYCPETKDKSGYEHYLSRMLDWYAERPGSIHKATQPLIRKPMSRELLLRLQMHAAAFQMAPDFDEHYRAGDYVCLNFNSPCAYLPLCNAAPGMIPMIVRDQYRISHREDEEDADGKED